MATKNIVPRADGEGGIGTSVKRWLNGFFKNIDVSVEAKVPTAANSENSTKAASTAFVKNVLASYMPMEGNAGYHNSIFRGKSLGSSVTTAQWNAISAGTFDDLFIGDYWTINSVNWRIAAFDYWLKCGDTDCTTHHAVIVPDTNLTSAKMNNSNVTTGAYVGSDYYTGNNSNTGKSTAQTAINNAFGSSHILSHKELLANAVTDGKASGWSWYASTFELMNESMVYGHPVWGQSGYETGIDRGQLPLFALAPQYISNLRAYWWLRSVTSGTSFALVYASGYANYYGASNSNGVRPAFAIKS